MKNQRVTTPIQIDDWVITPRNQVVVGSNDPDIIVRTWGDSVDCYHAGWVMAKDFVGMRHGSKWFEMSKASWLPITILNNIAYKVFEKMNYQRLLVFHPGFPHIGGATLNQYAIKREYFFTKNEFFA